ncbi:hypothetical protein HDU76_001506 [Blyttiomyces sp. JEL0837]|nr:hypothetical protein HDU76_001506 [Blyttiomyces sp. JEL0837]
MDSDEPANGPSRVPSSSVIESVRELRSRNRFRDIIGTQSAQHQAHRHQSPSQSMIVTSSSKIPGPSGSKTRRRTSRPTHRQPELVEHEDSDISAPSNSTGRSTGDVAISDHSSESATTTVDPPSPSSPSVKTVVKMSGGGPLRGANKIPSSEDNYSVKKPTKYTKSTRSENRRKEKATTIMLPPTLEGPSAPDAAEVTSTSIVSQTSDIQEVNQIASFKPIDHAATEPTTAMSGSSNFHIVGQSEPSNMIITALPPGQGSETLVPIGQYPPAPTYHVAYNFPSTLSLGQVNPSAQMVPVHMQSHVTQSQNFNGLPFTVFYTNTSHYQSIAPPIPLTYVMPHQGYHIQQPGYLYGYCQTIRLPQHYPEYVNLYHIHGTPSINNVNIMYNNNNGGGSRYRPSQQQRDSIQHRAELLADTPCASPHHLSTDNPSSHLPLTFSQSDASLSMFQENNHQYNNEIQDPRTQFQIYLKNEVLLWPLQERFESDFIHVQQRNFSELHQYIPTAHSKTIDPNTLFRINYKHEFNQFVLSHDAYEPQDYEHNPMITSAEYQRSKTDASFRNWICEEIGERAIQRVLWRQRASKDEKIGLRCRISQTRLQAIESYYTRLYDDSDYVGEQQYVGQSFSSTPRSQFDSNGHLIDPDGFDHEFWINDAQLRLSSSKETNYILSSSSMSTSTSNEDVALPSTCNDISITPKPKRKAADESSSAEVKKHRVSNTTS